MLDADLHKMTAIARSAIVSIRKRLSTKPLRTPFQHPIHGLEVDNQLKLCRLLDWEIGRLSSF
jgi:hypothetical protein